MVATAKANMSLWVYDLRRSSMTRIAFGWNNHSPNWTPDGRQITFASPRSGEQNLYQTASDGSGPTERLHQSDQPQTAPSWSPDSTALAFVQNEDIWWLPMDGERKPRPFLQTEFRERFLDFSPNGRWIAYESDESGQFEVYIRPFPPSAGKWPVSTGGGTMPRWNSNGKEIFYRDGDAMMVVGVAETEEGGINLGNPTKLFERFSYGWDVASDGQRFVSIEPGEPDPAPTRLHLIMNWSEELKRSFPRTTEMALNAGSRLAEYEILALIGAGGMGEVYRARDTKLGREVAIKILPEAFSQNKERLARFEREAQLLASLNHPGIATLHGFEKHDDVRFLVMELVEGETLEARIEQGPIPIDEALPLFAQMAEAMEAAHTKGVIHRDLKPANIKITPDGRPKILDFGLAKGYATPESNVSQSPTLTRGTSAGIILGTAPYMSPEQARGKSLDKRTDIWAFGCVLYEALTARRAFDGETVADILGRSSRRSPIGNRYRTRRLGRFGSCWSAVYRKMSVAVCGTWARRGLRSTRLRQRSLLKGS